MSETESMKRPLAEEKRMRFGDVMCWKDDGDEEEEEEEEGEKDEGEEDDEDVEERSSEYSIRSIMQRTWALSLPCESLVLNKTLLPTVAWKSIHLPLPPTFSIILIEEEEEENDSDEKDEENGAFIAKFEYRSAG